MGGGRAGGLVAGSVGGVGWTCAGERGDGSCSGNGWMAGRVVDGAQIDDNSVPPSKTSTGAELDRTGAARARSSASTVASQALAVYAVRHSTGAAHVPSTGAAGTRLGTHAACRPGKVSVVQAAHRHPL